MEYGKMIFLSEDAKEKFSKMSEEELDMVSGLLAENIIRAQIEICKKLEESSS